MKNACIVAALVFPLIGSGLAACGGDASTGLSTGSSKEAAGSSSEPVSLSGVDENDELDVVLGHDRMRDVLSGHVRDLPRSFSELEARFSIGRHCPRTESKEIFVAEEPSSRLTGKQVATLTLLPRVVVAGCNIETPSARTLDRSFGMFVAVVSDPARPVSDPLSLGPKVEVMALDHVTGLFNFYVLEADGPGGTASLTRFQRTNTDVILKHRKVLGSAPTHAVTTDRRCFDCHVNGGPIMNEMTDPWSNWVSSRRTFSETTVTGDTREIVGEARPFHGEHTRASLANDLESIIETGIGTWVEGFEGHADTGLGASILAHAEPGGIPRLLRSVFCETELNFVSSFDTLPMPLFFDTQAAAVAGLERPIEPSVDMVHLFPVRAEADLRIERFLEKRGILSPNTVTAVRLLDDENDVFSPVRCGLHARASLAAVFHPTTVDAAVRSVVHEALSSLSTLSASTPAKTKYLAALTDAHPDSAAIDAAADAYAAELATRMDTKVSALDTAAGVAALATRVTNRQHAASAMFARDARPLPTLPR